MKIKYILVIGLCVCMAGASAQLGLGFKAGLSMIKIEGDSEMADGKSLEEFNFSSGFMIGVVFNYEVTDLFGFRTELLYSQKSSRYKYEGPGYFFLQPTEELVAVGDRKLIELDINNTYLDIPIMAYYRFGKFEVNGGFNIGFLLGSKANGIRQFRGFTQGSGAEVTQFEQTLVYNYISDSPLGFDENEGAIIIDQNGIDVLIPRVPFAYFDYPPLRNTLSSTPLYKRLEIGLVGGVQYYPNPGLSVGARFHYGLSDITNDEVDISQQEIDADSELILRNDVDKNRGFQFTIMFLF